MGSLVLAACADATPSRQASAASQPVPSSGTAPPVCDESHGRDLPEGAANLDFIVFNRTGRTITALSISPAGKDSCSVNLLTHPEVASGERAAAAYSRDVELCTWDVRVPTKAAEPLRDPAPTCATRSASSCAELDAVRLSS